MRKDLEDAIFFSDVEELKDKTPMQGLLLDVINTVNRRIIKFYLSSESQKYDIKPHEMLVMVMANVFSNLANSIIYPRDISTKLRVFEILNNELSSLNNRLFLTLQTYYNADEQKIN